MDRAGAVQRGTARAGARAGKARVGRRAVVRSAHTLRRTPAGMTRPLAVVTGASRGIGRAIAKRLAEKYDILALARSRDALESLAADIGAQKGTCRVATLDVANAPVVARALDGVDADVLVNNAGVGPMKPMLDL